MDTLGNLALLEDGTWIDAVAWNSLLADPQPERPLIWYWSINGVGSDWEDLTGIGHLAQLVNDLPDDGDFLVLADKDPETRYAQTMQMENGTFTVEIGMCIPNGALNLRVGKGAAAANEPNKPGEAVTALQTLSRAETIQVLMSWASGSGLPLGYAGAIYSYT
ncbi:hypothetical protein E9229_003502 [Paeniglutamicibacter cryotolerans]|uniref:Uncharacterized protein n=2 Tax=Paeniglutamicibacter cryotolerans TaxID=670079 RepID=A0A839QRF6_9MICC|nr:hypothetical protein [Paeniglutamicibacter cryotolerans]